MKKIIIFGASVAGEWAKEKYERSNFYKVYAFADNDKTKENSIFCGLPVLSAKSAVETGCFIVISSLYSKEISEQLKILGTDNFCVFDEDFIFCSKNIVVTDSRLVEKIGNEYLEYSTCMIKEYDNILLDLNMDINKMLMRLEEMAISRDSKFIALGKKNEEIVKILPNISFGDYFFDLPFIEYLKLKLAILNNEKALNVIENSLNKYKYYDYDGIYPLNIYEKKDKIFCDIYDVGTQKAFKSFEIEKDYIEKRQYNVCFTRFNYKENLLNLMGNFNSQGLPITQNIKFKFYLESDGERIFLDHKNIEENHFSDPLYPYDKGGFAISINLNQLSESNYTLKSEIEIYGIKILNFKFKFIKSFIQRMENIFFDLKSFNLLFNNDVIKICVTKYFNDTEFSISCKKSHDEYLLKNISQAQLLNIDNDKKNSLIRALEDYSVQKHSLPDNIWLVGEKWGNTANDNGISFFKRLVKNKEINSYYVIDKDSKDYEHVSKIGDCLDFCSYEHFLYSLHAKAIFTNGNPNALLPYDGIDMMIKKARVNLQHGVMYTGNQVLYDHAIRDRSDFCMTSCETETKIFQRYYGYNKSQLIETGMSRYDDLIDVSSKNQIGIMFTWRRNINNLSEMENSLYFKNIKELIEEIVNYKKDIIINLCLHPKVIEAFKKDNESFEKLFDSLKICKNINILKSSSDISDMIKKSGILITDYSSLTFDFLYLNKPIIHYIFDYSYVLALSRENLSETLPGNYVDNIKELMLCLELYFKNDLKNNKMKSKFNFNRCRNNSQRGIDYIKKILPLL